VGLPRLGIDRDTQSAVQPISCSVSTIGRPNSFTACDVGQPGRRLFLAGDEGSAAKSLAEFRGEIAHDQISWPLTLIGEVGRIAMRQTTQRLRRCIALPDEIDMAEADVDRLALQDLARDIVQHAVAHVDRVIEPNSCPGVEYFREKYSNMRSRPTQDCAYFAGRIGRHILTRAFAVHRHEWIDAAGRERDDARTRKGLRDQAGTCEFIAQVRRDRPRRRICVRP
jgi:hypothetical protein